ncbi:MAG: DNA alkylation repair protein [Pseudomonadota bacterium]
MSPDDAIAALRAAGDPQKAAEMAAYHKASRTYLGVANPVLDGFGKAWRAEMAETPPQIGGPVLPSPSLSARLDLAQSLWDSDIHEARILAAKLLTQARFNDEDAPVWSLIAGWVPDFDAWAIADHAAIAGQKRLLADPSRLDEVETWTTSPHIWTRRAALVFTLPWPRLKSSNENQLATRSRILSWAAGYVSDSNWFIQKAIAWWLRELSKRDPAATRAFLAQHGADMKAFARREAGRYLT